MLDQITPLVITFNEAPNLARTLNGVRWASEILLVDSFSTDQTLEIARSFPQVRVIQREFDSFAGQCNFGLSHIRTPWVLSLDADYIVTDALNDELRQLTPDGRVSGYRAFFRYCIHGAPLRGTLYPPRTVLYRASQARYESNGHGHRVRVDGLVKDLKGSIWHDDRKPLSRWLDAQRKYAAAEVSHLAGIDPAQLGWADWLRLRIWPAAPAALVYTLLVKGCLLDGWPGWLYALQRTYAELLLSIELLEFRLKERSEQ
jgi:glycosyltransferase involved in cell wall biosynthesis